MTQKTCPFTKALAHLKRFAGLPVPYAVKWVSNYPALPGEHNGLKPDFRQIDQEKWAQAVQHKLCGVCGKVLGEWAFYIGGPACRESHLFLDPAMHRVCAEASMQLCLFLNGTKPTYRGDDVPGHPDQDHGMRSKPMILMRGIAKEMKLVSYKEHFVIYAGKQLTTVKEF